MCPLMINGEDARDLIPILKFLTFHQPKRLSDIFNAFGLRLSENIHIRAFGNKPYITVYVYHLKDGLINRTVTITPLDFLYNKYLTFGLSPSLVSLLNEVNVRYCSDLKLQKQEPIKQFRIVVQEQIKPYLMVKCPKTETHKLPATCKGCFYFAELMPDNSVVCSYVPYNENTGRPEAKRIIPKPTLKPYNHKSAVQLKTNQ
jgi:hypothetical protein